MDTSYAGVADGAPPDSRSPRRWHSGAWDVPQAFGHTPARKSALRHAHGLKLINVDAGMFEFYGGHRVYLEITADDTLVQHSKDGARWISKVLRGAGASG